MATDESSTARIEDLIRRASEGDPEAWEGLHARFGPWMLRQARWLCGDAAGGDEVDPEVVAQETWVNLYGGTLNKFEGGSFEAFLKDILRKRQIDLQRKANREKRRPNKPILSVDQKAGPHTTTSLGDAVGSPRTSPPSAAVRKEVWALCEDVLNPQELEIVCMKMTGLTFQEIADQSSGESGIEKVKRTYYGSMARVAKRLATLGES